EEARVLLQQRQPDATRVRQPLELLTDRLQHSIEVVLLEQQRPQALEANHLLEAGVQLGVQPRIVEADRRLAGERRKQLDLARVERLRVVGIRREGAEGASPGTQRQHQQTLLVLLLGVIDAFSRVATCEYRLGRERRTQDLWASARNCRARKRALDGHAHRVKVDGVLAYCHLDFQLAGASTQELDRHGGDA